MRCERCGGNFGEPIITTWHYTRCGLPNVMLDGVEVSACTTCDNKLVSIPHINDLYKELALAVATHSGRLTGAEIRFLRKYLGYSGKDFAKHIGVGHEQVSRWENGKVVMDLPTEKLLRLMARTMAPIDDYEKHDQRRVQPRRDELQEAMDATDEVEIELCGRFKPDGSGWAPAPPC